MKWKAIHKVRVMHFRESVVFGEKTIFVYGTVWEKGWDRKALCYRVLCDLVEFYHASRLIHLWIDTAYFTQETNLSIKLWSAEKKAVYIMKVSSQPREDQTGLMEMQIVLA